MIKSGNNNYIFLISDRITAIAVRQALLTVFVAGQAARERNSARLHGIQLP